MAEENLEEIYNELYDLREEFIKKYRKNIHDLKYYTKVRENEKRIAEIINSFVNILRNHDFLYQVIFENDEVDYENNKTYMEHTGLWNDKEFYSYSLKVIHKLEKSLK
jgi:hypothetical protein